MNGTRVLSAFRSVWLIAPGFDAVGGIILRLAFAAPGALLLGLPALAADISEALPASDVASASPMPPPRPPIALHDAPITGFSESGKANVHADVSEPESAPVIAPPQPTIAEPLVEALESPPSAQYKNLWDRMRAGFALPDMKGRLVARHQAWYLNRPKYVQRMLARSQRYLYFIVEELEKRNIPTEIALLPMIESAYDPQAYSRMRAAGIWQFIASTGRQYGLQQGAWYDGRRDVLSATRAALDYLQFLHDIFGDWQLALAAYNWGEGSVQRAVAKNRAHHKRITYANLNMPKETRNYLPKLQAIKNMICNPNMLGFELDAIPNQPYFAVVAAPGHIDVLKAAQLAGMPVEEFRALNAGYEGPLLIQGAGRQIVLPFDKVDEFHANLDNNNDPLVSWEPYTMKPGETLQKLASKFATTVSRLRRVNHFHRLDHIHPGEIVLVPLGSEDGMTEPDLLHNRAQFDPFPAIHRAGRSHRVRSVRGYTALPPRTILSDTPKRSTHARASSYTKPQPSLAQRR